MRPLDRTALRRLGPARRPLAGMLAANLAGGLLIVGQAVAVAALVVGVIGGHGSWRTAAIWVAAIGLARAAISVVVDRCAQTAAGQVSRTLRAEVVAAAAHPREQDLTLLATRGVAAAEPYVTRYLPALATTLVLPIITIIAVAWADLWSALILVLTLPLVPVFAALVGMRTQNRADRQWRALSLLSGHFRDLMLGLPTLVNFNRATGQSARVRSITERYRRTSAQTLRLGFASGAVLELIATLSVALVAVTIGLRLSQGAVGLETALVVLLLAPEAYWPWRRVGAEFHAAAEGIAALTEIDALDAVRPAAPRPTSEREGVDPVPLLIDDLEARYPGRLGPALRLDHAVVPATGITAVVGPSGSGKSTLLAVLLGELAPTGGSVTLAGEPLADDWPSLVAQVPQRPWVLPGTLADNVAIGRPGASRAEILAALDAVELPAEDFPDGADTIVGEDGYGLSAGQAARLALARVVLADRPYVFLDEPTAHLDDATEAVLVRTLQRMAVTSTVLVVAHRPALAEVADQVITIDPPVAGSAPEQTKRQAAVVRPSEHAADETVEPTRDRFWLSVLLGAGSALAGIALTATAGWLIARAAEHPQLLTLMVAIVGVRTFGIARPALRFAERIVSHDSALRMLAARRAEVYDVLVPLVPARLGRRRGDLLTRIVDDVDAVVDQRLRVRLPRWTAVTAGALTTLATALFAPLAGLVVGAVVAVGLLAGAIAQRGVASSERDFVAARAELSAEVETTVASARQLALWQADGPARARIDALGALLANCAARSTRSLALARALVIAAGTVGVAATAFLTRPAIADASLSGPVAAFLVLVPLALIDVLLPLVDAGALEVRTRAASDRLDELARTEPAITDPAVPLAITAAAPIRLQDAATGWTDTDVISGVTAEVEAGDTLVVTGPSGSGKSTLAALLAGHLPVHEGSYTLANAVSGAIGPHEIRRHVLYADSEPHIFATSVRENLRLAQPGCPDEVLLAAIEAAGLTPWLGGLPHGLDTLLVGDLSLSGGERARIGVARALLATPDVLVADEPTAHLDTDTAAGVASALLAGDGAVVWIGHDATTTALAERHGVQHLELGAPAPKVVPWQYGSHPAS